MEKIKEFFTGKTKDFYIMTATAALAFLTVISFVICFLEIYFTDHKLISVVTLIISDAVLLLGIALSALFTVKNKLEVGSLIVGLINLIAFAVFVYGIYYYVSVVIVGIDLKSFAVSFIVCFALFVLLLIASVMSIFAKHGEEQ